MMILFDGATVVMDGSAGVPNAVRGAGFALTAVLFGVMVKLADGGIVLGTDGVDAIEVTVVLFGVTMVGKTVFDAAVDASIGAALFALRVTLVDGKVILAAVILVDVEVPELLRGTEVTFVGTMVIFCSVNIVGVEITAVPLGVKVTLVLPGAIVVLVDGKFVLVSVSTVGGKITDALLGVMVVVLDTVRVENAEVLKVLFDATVMLFD